MRHKSLFITIILTGCLLFAYCGLTNEVDSAKIKINLKNPEDLIKKELLKNTPLNTAVNEVMFFIKNKLHYKSPKQPRYWADHAIPGKKLSKRQKIIHIKLGTYGHEISSLFLLGTVVEAAWVFDNNDKLIDIRVWRTGDAL